jgi:hypothetical protein
MGVILETIFRSILLTQKTLESKQYTTRDASTSIKNSAGSSVISSIPPASLIRNSILPISSVTSSAINFARVSTAISARTSRRTSARTYTDNLRALNILSSSSCYISACSSSFVTSSTAAFARISMATSTRD